MFHIRFSSEEDYLHQHELYEMLRSRNLYQVQFDLKKRLEKRIRSIEQAEKMHIATSQSKKTLFLQTVQERIKKRNRFGERYKRHYSSGDIEEEVEKISQPPRMFPKHKKEEPPDTNDKDMARSQTAPELAFPQKDNDDMRVNVEEEITSLRRNVTFCGKSFPMAKSAKRRAKHQNLTSVEEEKEIIISTETADDIVSDSLRLPDINYAIAQPDDSRKKRTLSPANLAVMKNMSMFESGVTAPDGRLILSRQDYDKFIDQYRQAQKHWLQKQRRKSESLEEKIKNFKIVSDGAS
jgi:hypothetical protein